MEPFGLPASPRYEIAVFNGNSMSAGASWHTWMKPQNKTFASILVIGGGGGGGVGAIGANSTAAGGGGGGSGGMTVVEIPLAILPPRLYISVGHAVAAAGIASYVSIAPVTTAENVVAIANGGGLGGNASGATAGAAGAAATAVGSNTMNIGGPYMNAFGGQAGIIGATTGSASNLTLPVTGLQVTGGTGGGGLPASAVVGSNSGGFIVPSQPSFFLFQPGASAPATATQPATPGNNGFKLINNGSGAAFYYGGAGGSSTHGSATGAGLVQAPGGNGAIGCGGGGSGGALTGSTAAAKSYGGPGLVVITCY